MIVHAPWPLRIREGGGFIRGDAESRCRETRVHPGVLLQHEIGLALFCLVYSRQDEKKISFLVGVCKEVKMQAITCLHIHIFLRPTDISTTTRIYGTAYRDWPKHETSTLVMHYPLLYRELCAPPPKVSSEVCCAYNK